MTRTAAATCLAVAVFVAPTRAWGPKGHEVVALIAEDRLSKHAATKIRELLGPDPHLDQIANCADWVRDGHGAVRCASFSIDADSTTTRWHVLGIPLASTPTTASVDGFCGDGCLLSAIERQRAVLADNRAPRFDRQKALMYLVHFTGDLHQPLHCALDDAPVAFRDRFGNTKAVVWKGKSHKLHHYWDQMLLTDAEARKLDARALTTKLEKDLAARDARARRRSAGARGRALGRMAGRSAALARCRKNFS